MKKLLIAMLLTTAILADDLGNKVNSILKPLVRVSTSQGTGSGAIIYSEDREGTGEHRTFVLTNWHVVSDAIHLVKKWDSLKQEHVYVEENDLVTVEMFSYLRGGKTVLSQPVKAKIQAYKVEEDMALLELDTPLKTEAVAELFPTGETLSLLQEVYAVGCSLGVDPIVTTGHITDLEVIIEHKVYVMASANIIYGNSGGGVFTEINKKFYFIGIPSRVTVTRQGQAMTHMGYFIPPARIRGFFEAQCLNFLLDKDITPTQSFEDREQMREE